MSDNAPVSAAKDDPAEMLRRAARALTRDALATIEAIMRDDSVSAKVRLAAASMILDRGHGKTAQAIDITAKSVDLTELHKEAMRAAALHSSTRGPLLEARVVPAAPVIEAD